MRLLNAKAVLLRESSRSSRGSDCKETYVEQFAQDNIPQYLIVSHRWERDEVTYHDFEKDAFRNRRGYQKIKAACRLALERGYWWVWLDTCCIDKDSLAELGEAINSMYRWYKKSSLCVAFLFDHEDGVDALSKSSWFTRSWTLQELIAPNHVEFYDRKWRNIGSRQERCHEISEITGIDVEILLGANPRDRSIAQRMSWAAGRSASRVEDEAYSLLGLFGISLPLVYGSGRETFQSLQEKLLQRTDDQSIFAWASLSPEEEANSDGRFGLLSRSPAAFAGCHDIHQVRALKRSFIFSSGRVEIDVLTIPYTVGTYLCSLDCSSKGSEYSVGVLLEQLEGREQYARIIRNGMGVVHISNDRLLNDPTCQVRKLKVPQILRDPPLSIVRGFCLRELEFPGYSKHTLEHIRICSRQDGVISNGSNRKFVQLPADSWGTAGLVYISKQDVLNRSSLVSWIRLGFDADFHPTVQLGNGQLAMITANIREATKRAPEQGSRFYSAVWNNDWLTREPRVRTKRDQNG